MTAIRDVAGPEPDMHTTRMIEKKAATQPLRPYEKQDTLKQFLEYDQQVLRFYCLWDDTDTEHGDRRYMVLHYFLADDTVEVNEVLAANCGRDGSGAFLKRQPLPRSASQVPSANPPGTFTNRTVLNVISSGGGNSNASRHILDSLRLGAPDTGNYTAEDFVLGGTVQLFGRPLLLCDCDEFTKKFYETKYGVTSFTPIDVTVKPKSPPPPIISGPTGFGTEEDSMVSVEHLVLQPPRTQPGRYYPRESKADDGSLVLRFAARIDTSDPLVVDRRFIICYYLVNDTMAIFERPIRNSGQLAGKFLERGLYSNVKEGRHWDLSDLYKGASVAVNSYTFIIEDADEYAFVYMERLGLPYSNTDVIKAKLNNAAAACLSSAGACRSKAEFALKMSQAAAGSLNEHEIETLARELPF